MRELKTLLDERRVDYRDCVEKRDLIRRARETGHLPRRTTIASLACIVFDSTSTSSSPAPPEWVVIILHGYGANREDLVPLGQAAAQQMSAATTDAASGPRVRFIHPNAPLAMTTEGGASPGSGRMWWPIDLNAMLLSFLSGQVTKSVPPGLDEARKAVLAMVEQVQRDTGLPLSRFILAGFSQGAMLATDVALHLPESPAALCIFSGVLICEDVWKPLMAKRQGMKVLQSHGTQDPLLPQALGVLLKNGLEAAGVPVEFISFGGGHTLPPSALEAFVRLLLANHHALHPNQQ